MYEYTTFELDGLEDTSNHITLEMIEDMDCDEVEYWLDQIGRCLYLETEILVDGWAEAVPAELTTTLDNIRREHSIRPWSS